jgi:hypothetical protein
LDTRFNGRPIPREYASAPGMAQAHPLDARRLCAPARHGLPSSAPGHRPHSSPSRSIPIDVDGTLGDRREAGSEVSACTGCNPPHGTAPVVREAVCCIRTLLAKLSRSPSDAWRQRERRDCKTRQADRRGGAMGAAVRSARVWSASRAPRPHTTWLIFSNPSCRAHWSPIRVFPLTWHSPPRTNRGSSSS